MCVELGDSHHYFQRPLVSRISSKQALQIDLRTLTDLQPMSQQLKALRGVPSSWPPFAVNCVSA